MFMMQKHLGCILTASGVLPLISVVDPVVPRPLRTQLSCFQMVQLLLTVSGADTQSHAKGALFQDSSVTLCRNGCCSPSHSFIHSPPQCNSQHQTHASPRQIIIVEWRPEIEVSVSEGVREGGCGNVPVVNYTVDSRIPSEGSAADACCISTVRLINLLTNTK